MISSLIGSWFLIEEEILRGILPLLRQPMISVHFISKQLGIVFCDGYPWIIYYLTLFWKVLVKASKGKLVAEHKGSLAWWPLVWCYTTRHVNSSPSSHRRETNGCSCHTSTRWSRTRQACCTPLGSGKPLCLLWVHSGTWPSKETRQCQAYCRREKGSSQMQWNAQVLPDVNVPPREA